MKLTSQTKILIAALLLVAAAAAWYTLYIQGQASPKAQALAPSHLPKPTAHPALPTKAQTVTSTSARALEILPLPFLVTAPPKETASPPAETKERPKKAKTGGLEAVKVPPNPFVPLPQQRKALLAAERPTESAPKPQTPPSTEQPVVLKPAEAPELVRVPVPKLPSPPPSEPVLPPESRISLGVLPIKLQPVEKEVAPPASQAEATGARGSQGAPENPLMAWAQKQKLKLVGVALGPVSVAIFATKDGYLALPVGERFPGTDIRLKAVTAERVLLAQGDYDLTLEYGGGG